MASIAVLQARTNSSRLPGKVLLPINGIPLVVLAAKRAANTGRDVIVATSTETVDDALVKVLEQNEIGFYRGSLENTLERIVSSLEKYGDDTLVFRLTADNVFPDGELLDQIEEDFIERNLDYICCNGDNSGLPYGMSAELTYLSYLRESLQNTQCSYDQEHVTPYIRRKYGENYFTKHKELNKGHFRCTVDCLDDYLSVQQVFSEIKDPVYASSFYLIKILNIALYQPLVAKPTTKLVLGTAQLGLPYGVANSIGQPSKKEAEHLIKIAISNGVTYIDTARAYGSSEEVIGNTLSYGWQGRAKIITKLSPLDECPLGSCKEVVNAFVDASIYQSKSALRVQELDVLMLHRVSHITNWEGAVWDRVQEHKAGGIVRALGVSVQSPEELEAVLNLPDVIFIQMPFNILDWRWESIIPKLIEEKQKRELIIHVRSALLQGLLLSDSKEHWQKAHILNPEIVISWLKEQAKINNRTGVADYCLGYVQSLEWVDGVVVGMESFNQLVDNIKIFATTEFSCKYEKKYLKSRPYVNENTLNPVLWK